MNRMIRILGVVAVMALGGVGWRHASVAQAATAPNSTCPTGALQGGTYNNVTVLMGHSCYIQGVTILGNLVGQAGNTGIDADFLHIFGNLQDDHGANLFLGVNVQLGFTIDGNLQVTHMTGYVEVDGEFNSFVGGNGQFSNNTGEVLIAEGPNVGGNLQINNNTGGVALAYIHIGNTLDCENNNPPPFYYDPPHFPIAAHYKGQCQS